MTRAEGKAGYQKLCRSSAGVPCTVMHLDSKDLFSHHSVPSAGRGRAHD